MTGSDQIDLEIAIVGMAGRFPGADSVTTFWENMRSGVESIRDLSEEELRSAGLDDAALSDPRLVRRAADLPAIDLFDAHLFGFTPREAELTDPQFRVFLEDSWTALENAGHLTDRQNLRVGVFAGASGSSYLMNNVAANPRAAEALGAFQTSLGNEKDYLAAQVSYRLDLRGPSVVVQTACSTSLVAVHLACQSLLGRECDVALAGGVSITVPQATGYFHEEGDIASPDGRCRAFDADAAGCLKGDGSGAVVLRRLEDALREGDRILAVIKGSAVNNDGGLKVGFTAPSVEGQAGVIAEALAVSGVEPETIGYVEAHGTATSLGDPVEVAALARAFGPGAARGGRCGIGSLKSNVGHLDAAAGVAGLIKTVLALHHGEIPPSLHFQRPNPKIDFDATPFYVNSELRPWPSGATPRRAGVSSFGIGGTNAHLILEEAPAPPAAHRARRMQVLVLSGASEPAVDAAAESLAAHLDANPAISLADVAFTLQVGRKRLPWRRAVVAPDAGRAAAALRSRPGPAGARHEERRGAEVAFLFPGQGSQHAGMARGLHRDEPAFRGAFDRCAEILRPRLGRDLRELVLAEPDPGGEAEARLRETSLAQPALFAVEYAVAQMWISWGVRPAAMLGHSVGELVAACLAGVMSLEDALVLVAERGALMGGMPPGAMLAVQLPEEDVAGRLRERPSLDLAAVNGPSSCVVSGPAPDTERLEEELSAEGIACRRLHTSHAFHSAMMDPVAVAFEETVRRIRLTAPSIPFISNVTGTWIDDEQAVKPSYWSSHLRRAVRFADGVATLAADSSRVLLEAGPGTALSGLSRTVAGRDAVIVATLPHRKSGGDDAGSVHEALGRLWCAGVDIDWMGFHEGHGRRRVALPTYPFQRQSHWIGPSPGRAARTFQDPAGKNPDLAAWFYIPGWKRGFMGASREPSPEPAPSWLLFDDGSELGRAVAAAGEERGSRVAIVRAGDRYERRQREFTIDPWRREDYDRLLMELGAEDFLPGRVVHLWCARGAETDAGSAQDLGFFALVHLGQALGQVAGTAGMRLVAVAGDLFDVTGEKVTCPERATLAGFCRVAQQEYAGLTCRLVDPEMHDPGEAARRIVMELEASDREPVVAWRGGRRWLPSYEPVRLEPGDRQPEPIRKGGAYLVTGGGGPLEIALARRLAAAGAAVIGLLGCRELPPDLLEELRGGGTELLLAGAPVTHAAAAGDLVARLRTRSGRLDAIFHTAGEIGGGMIQLKEREAAERVLAPRLGGAPLLAGLLGRDEMLVIFSSAISATGVFGQADYCAASSFLDAFANARRGARDPRVITIGWGMALWDRWQDTSGPGSEALMAQLREIQAAIGITVEEGIDALWRALRLGEPNLMVSTQDLDEQVEQSRSATVAGLLEGVGQPRPGAAGREAREVAELESETERGVAAVWTELLGIDRIGRTDNFFELGGNSLLAIQLAANLRKVFEIDLTIASLFEASTLESLAGAVDRALEERRSAEEVARILDEIEGLSVEQIQAELGRRADAEVSE